MIKCVGSDVWLKRKCVGHVAGGAIEGFYLQFKSGRMVWLDEMCGVGRVLSLEAATAVLTDSRYSESIIVASLTGSLPVSDCEAFLPHIMKLNARPGFRG